MKARTAVKALAQLTKVVAVAVAHQRWAVMRRQVLQVSAVQEQQRALAVAAR
jgi:hypothetical protein